MTRSPALNLMVFLAYAIPVGVFGVVAYQLSRWRE